MCYLKASFHSLTLQVRADKAPEYISAGIECHFSLGI